MPTHAANTEMRFHRAAIRRPPLLPSTSLIRLLRLVLPLRIAHEAVEEGLIRPPLAEPVAEAVGRNDIEHPPVDPAVLFDVEFGEFLLQPITLELCQQCVEVLNVEGTAILCGIPTVLRESDLNLVAG